MTEARPHQPHTQTTTRHSRCDEFPDVAPQHVKDGLEDQMKQAEADNERKRHMYRAMRYLLTNDFGMFGKQLPETGNRLPETADRFPGDDLTAEEIAQYLAINGLMLADNYTDPTLGKDRASGDDVTVSPGTQKSFFISRRFADQVVKAVQEYTAQADLFQKVYLLMLAEGTSATGSGAERKSSTTARA